MSKQKKKIRKTNKEESFESEIQNDIQNNRFRNFKLNIKDFKLTDKQKSLAQIAFDRNTKVIFVSGCAGSSKTFLSVYCALHMLNKNPGLEIKYIRTIAESGERNLGALPGTIGEKFNPFMMPLYDKLDELIPINQSKILEEQGVIEALPVNYLRGASWKDKIIIADETQNFSIKELTTLITRIGENTKMFVCGDPMQSDIGNKSGFSKMFDIFNNETSEKQGIHCFEFSEEDIMRSEILKYIIKVLKGLDKNPVH